MSAGELQKQRLVEYLIDQVSQGISGRDGNDIIDISPARALFAGVLQPARQADVSGNAELVPPADTSLGVDFRIRVRPDITPKITIKARWSHYYPVFPNYQQARTSNNALFQAPPGNASVASTPEVAVRAAAISATEADDGTVESEENGDEAESANAET
ncbi:MAG: hypothetical protein ACXWIU_06775, partial [Limisphaerales bacterium]